MSEQERRGQQDQEPAQGQVSEVSSMDDGTEGGQPDAVAPEDATAGYPDSESGEPEEGTAGPDAPPRHGRPEPSNESSR